jgi:hypothetical protein
MQRILLLLACAVQCVVCASVQADDSIAARYEATYGERDGPEVPQSAWYFVRSASRIETASGDRAEVWQRAGNGAITLARVFHAYEVVVEYASAELAARELKPDWEALGSIVSASARGALKLTNTQVTLGGTARVLRGQADGQEVEVWWLEAQRIPALVKRKDARGTFTLRLAELHDDAPAQWPLTRQWPTNEYRWVDAADLGDLEHDPLIKKLLRDQNIQASAHHALDGAH